MFLCAFAYQNCAQSFRTVSIDQNLTQQCKLAIRDAAARSEGFVGDVDCESVERYRCELRIFSPDLQDREIPNDRRCFQTEWDICVVTDVREISTAGTRAVAGLDPAEFEPGGEFHRQEARCHHERRVRGIAVFEGSGPRLADAFTLARAACRQSQSQESP